MGSTGDGTADDALRRLLSSSVAHDRIPDRVDPALTILAWTGLALLALQWWIVDSARGSTNWFVTNAVMHWAFSGFGHPSVALWITGLAVGVGLIGAAITRGFTRATVVGQSGQLSLVGGGVVAAVPTAWIVIAMVVFVVLVALAIVATIAIVFFVFLAALEEI